MRAVGTIEIAVRPGGRAVRRDADGEIEIEADPQAGCARPRLRGDELPVGEPLQPGVEVDELLLLLGEGAHGIGSPDGGIPPASRARSAPFPCCTIASDSASKSACR